MIASVVATLEHCGADLPQAITEISMLGGVEIGDFDHRSRRVPLTIDVTTASLLEETTRRLQECSGVAFVDVVFVHFEEVSRGDAAASTRETTFAEDAAFPGGTANP